MTDQGTRKERKFSWGTKKIEKFKTILNGTMKNDRKQTDHRTFKSDFNNREMKIQTKDRMDEKLEIANKTSQSM